VGGEATAAATAATHGIGGTHGFTSSLTSFVGRADDAVKLDRLLGEYRLVTVTGPGGVGKTRLATEVGRQAAARFADGVWLVELAAVPEAALVATAVATALGVQQARGHSVLESLAGVLSRRNLLLILDNCEHLLGAVAELCGSLLSAGDDLRVLATSREPIGMAGETRYRLRPLPVAGPDSSAASALAAITLFADRARQTDPSFELSGETVPVVAQLVRRLDGMPLAIELAAARVEALGLMQLLERIEDRFDVLAGGNRGAASRQQSLAAAVDWSYQLLGDHDRQVFRRLAMFPGPFSLDSAEAVAGPGSEAAVLHLVDCSLLTPPQAGLDGRSRYAMLQTLQAFGMDRLTASGERHDAESALAAYAVRVAEQVAAGMQASGTEAAAARRLDAEDGAVHQGLAWALDHDRPAALRLAVALAPWWHLRGRYLAGYGLLRRAAEVTQERHERWYAAQYWLGRMAAYMSDFPAAVDYNTVVCDAIGPVPPSAERALALASRATALLNLDRQPEAAEDAQRALRLARETGYRPAEAHALVALAYAAQMAGDTEAALAWARQTQQVDPQAVPGWISRPGRLVYASTLKMAGQLEAAQQVCADGLAGARAVGDLGDQASFLYLMAVCARLAGQQAEAGAHIGECLGLAVQAGNRLRVIDCLDESGFLCAATGKLAEAITLWAAYTAQLRAIGVPDMPQEARIRQEPVRQAAEALGPAGMHQAEDRGAAMTLDTAAELAVMLTRPSPGRLDSAPGLTELSTREAELVILVAQGLTDAQIAAKLYISISTVRSHLDRIRDKTSCRRRADLTRLALQTGLV
jgi:predicted ATPase/DNA-binding CsgD family transcriptional regulator